jgi:hypothetical protein
MKGNLVDVEYPTLVAMEAKKERTSELNELPCHVIHLLWHTRQLVGFLTINVVMLVHKTHDCFKTSIIGLDAKGIWEQR